MPGPDRARAPRPQAVLNVHAREWLNPDIVRLTAGGPGIAQLRPNEFTDKYAKLLFVDPALGLVPPYDLAALRESLPAEQLPVTRTYTLRRMDLAAGVVVVDFVVHGDTGIAAPWAAAAEPGATLVAMGAGGAYAPDPADEQHVFLGDESALPAIASALEALPRDARGAAYLETNHRLDEIDQRAPAGVAVNWLHREHPGEEPTLLAKALTESDWPDGRVGVFAHGEREAMKAVRAALKGLDQRGGQLSLSGYWAYGRTEDRFQAEKREPVGQI